MTGTRGFKFLSLAVVAVLLFSPQLAAGEAEGKPAAKDQVEKKGSLRVEDLPKPIPKVMEKIKEVGDEAGKGITKAGSAIGEAVNKAVKGEKDKEK